MADRLLGLPARILPEAWMLLLCVIQLRQRNKQGQKDYVRKVKERTAKEEIKSPAGGVDVCILCVCVT
jgi:hypothetical protein